MIEITSDREIITIELAGSTVFGFMDSRSSVEQRKSLRVARHVARFLGITIIQNSLLRSSFLCGLGGSLFSRSRIC